MRPEFHFQTTAVVSRMTTLRIIMYGRYFGLQALIPVSTGILPHSLPEWTFRTRPAFWRIAFTLKLPELLKTTLIAIREKLRQASSFPIGPQIWCPIGQ